MDSSNYKATNIKCAKYKKIKEVRACHRLIGNEKIFKFAIEGGNFGIWDWNIETNEIYYSKRCKEILGYNEEEIDNNYYEWISRVHKEDIKHVLDKVQRHFRGEEYVVEYRLKCKDNNYKWVRTRGKVIKRNSKGEPIRMVGTNEDINEKMILIRKIEEDENRLRGIYDSIDVGLALMETKFDDYGNIIKLKCIDSNKPMREIFGEKEESALCESIIKFIYDYSDNWIDMFTQVVQNKKKYKFNKYSETLDKYFSVNVYSPNPMQIAFSLTDITDIKKKEMDLKEKYEELNSVYEELAATEEELRSNYKTLEQANKEIRKANKAKSQFLANMSHELRTPLNAIMGFTQLLQVTKLSCEQEDYLSMIYKSSTNLLELINDILSLSRIEAGKVNLKYEKFNFMELMESVMRELTLLTKDKNIDVMYYIDPFISKEIIGDVLRLKQVINNLISNAVKFTEKGHIYLRVKMIYKTIEEIKLEFSVEDTGIGISNEFKSEMFKLFSQEDLTYTKKYGGTGLGLAISKGLVELMNGDIWVESEIGKGSTFYFTAVLKGLGDEELNLKENIVINIKKKVNKEKNVLVVEDNEINLKIACAFLQQLNYKYISAKNGQEAIDYLEKNLVDIILMDIQMPILNGYDAIKIIRNREKNKEHKTIIAMTAYAMDGDKEKLIKAGADYYISKPFTMEELSDILGKCQNL